MAQANPQANLNYPISQDNTLIITQPDIDLHRIQIIARSPENRKIKTLIFRDCKGVSYENFCDLCRWNQSIHQVIFQNCKDFRKDAFEAFRCLDKTLNYLDLSGYHINIDELKSLLRVGFIDLQKAIFQNETDIHKLFPNYYPKCEIEFKPSPEAAKRRFVKSRSEYDIHVDKRIRELRKQRSEEVSKTPDELADGFHKLSMKHKHLDQSGFRAENLSTSSAESLKRKMREERKFCYEKNVYDSSSSSDDNASNVSADQKDYCLSPKKRLSSPSSASSPKHSLPKSPSKKSSSKR